MPLPALQTPLELFFQQRTGYTPATFFEEFYPKVRKQTLHFFYGNQTDADDAAAQTFLRTFRSIHTYQSGTELKKWMHKITLNACIDYYNSTKKRLQLQLNYTLIQDPRKTTPDLELRIRELIQQQVPAGFQEVLSLRVQGYEYKEIATELDIPIGTVMSRLHRARHYLKPFKEDFL